MGELLKIDHISYSYYTPTGETPVLNDVSFHVNEGEFVAITGPNGCGKSTLLSLIAGMLTPSSGFIYIDGKDIKSSGKSIGYMLKKDHLPDCPGTLKNVPLDSKAQEKLSDNNYVQINELLNSYGLITFPDSIPSELPGSLRQKTTFLRTLLLEPDILLLDEPFATLDYQVSLEDNDNIREAIWEVIRQEKKTTLLITSDIKEAMRMADRIIILSPRPGTVTQVLDLTQEAEPKRLSD